MESEYCYVISPGIATTSGITMCITLHILEKKSYPGMLEKATPLVVVLVVLPLLVMRILVLLVLQNPKSRNSVITSNCSWYYY